MSNLNFSSDETVKPMAIRTFVLQKMLFSQSFQRYMLLFLGRISQVDHFFSGLNSWIVGLTDLHPDPCFSRWPSFHHTWTIFVAFQTLLEFEVLNPFYFIRHPRLEQWTIGLQSLWLQVTSAQKSYGCQVRLEQSFDHPRVFVTNQTNYGITLNRP